MGCVLGSVKLFCARGAILDSDFLRPPTLFLFFPLSSQCDGCLSLLRGDSWPGYRVVPALGALFNLEAGWQKWKPLDNPGTQPPLRGAVVNHLKNVESIWP